MINGYEDINDNVKTQNGAWMTSWFSDHTEKLNLSIPDNDKDTVRNFNMIVDSVLEISRSQNSYRICREIVCVFLIQKQFLTRGNLSC